MKIIIITYVSGKEEAILSNDDALQYIADNVQNIEDIRIFTLSRIRAEEVGIFTLTTIEKELEEAIHYE